MWKDRQDYEDRRDKLWQKFAAATSRLDEVLAEAHEQGIHVVLEIHHCDGIMGVGVSVVGTDTPAGREFASSRGMIPENMFRRIHPEGIVPRGIVLDGQT